MLDPQKASRIRLLLLDVDGVLTDGRIGLVTGGEEIKFFSVQDGLGLKMAQRAGLRLGLLSGRTSLAVAARAGELGIELVYQGISDKLAKFQAILEECGLEPMEVAFIGDDLPDLPVIRQVGLSAAPANAVEEVRRQVDYVCFKQGGFGAVREFVDAWLRATGRWEKTTGLPDRSGF